MMQSACLNLTRGQYLDIAFENQNDLPLELYWQMVEGKTSSLLSACLGMGVLLGGADEKLQSKMINFGNKIGAAFQVQDDWLGIWGNMEQMGKSNTSDLVAKKKTYPILLGIQQKKHFYNSWRSMEQINPEDAHRLAVLLEIEGHQEATRKKFEQLYSEGFKILNSLSLDTEKLTPLRQVVEGLFGRIK